MEAQVSSQLSTEVIVNAEAFGCLENEWDRLLDESNQQVYFMRWRWTHLWWQHLAPADGQLRIIICRDENGVLAGVAPFYLRHHNIFGLVPVRELVFLGTGVELKTSEYLDISARRGQERAVARAMAAALKQRDDWDRIWCCWVPSDSSTLQEFMSALAERSTSRTFDQAPYIDTADGWAHYKNGLGRSMRRNVEYYARRLFKRYPCEFNRVDSEHEIDAALDALVQLNVTRWQSQGEIGSLGNPVFEKFLRQAAHHSLVEGRLRLWTLRINGSIEAVLVGFLDNGILHFFQKGHNPGFSKDDIGTAMVALCVRDCCDDQGIRAFDFMGGGAPYKTMWARSSRETTLGEVSRRNGRTLAFDLERRVTGAATAVYRALVPMSLRAVRRDWLKARLVREHMRRTARLILKIISPFPVAEEFLADGCLEPFNLVWVDSLAMIATTWI